MFKSKNTFELKIGGNSVPSKEICEAALNKEVEVKNKRPYPRSLVFYDPCMDKVMLFIPKNKFYYSVAEKMSCPITVVSTPKTNLTSMEESVVGWHIVLEDLKEQNLELVIAFCRHAPSNYGED